MQAHARAMIREVKEAASAPHGERVVGIQTEEPHTGLSLVLDVEAHVELGERGDARQIRQATRHHALHAERYDTHPRRPVVLLDLEGRRHECAQFRRGNGPMREQEVAPALPHEPRAARHRPGPVFCLGQRRMHVEIVLTNHQRVREIRR